MTSPRSMSFAQLALIALAIGCAAYLGLAHYPIGLDFQGGATLVIETKGDGARELDRIGALLDPGWVVVRLDDAMLKIDRADASSAEVDALVVRLAALQPPATVMSKTVIEASGPSWQGPPFAIAIAVLGALGWLAALVLRRTWPAVIGTVALAWVITVVDLVIAGSTFARSLHFAGLLWALPAAAVPLLAARVPSNELGRRFAAAWPAAIGLIVAFGIAILVAATRSPSQGLWHVAKVGLAHASHAAPILFVIAAVTILATPPRRPG